MIIKPLNFTIRREDTISETQNTGTVKEYPSVTIQITIYIRTNTLQAITPYPLIILIGI